MTSGRCGHLMYSAQAENTPAAISQNTGFCSACSAKCSQLPNARADLVQRRRGVSALKKMDSPKPPPNSSGSKVMAPMMTDGIASAMSGADHDPGLFVRRAAVVTVAMIVVGVIVVRGVRRDRRMRRMRRVSVREPLRPSAACRGRS